MRLNQLVYVANSAEALHRSFGQPFRQIDYYADADVTMPVVWNWMFRYVPRLRHYKVRYHWSDRKASNSIQGFINGVIAFDDIAGGPGGTSDHSIDLQRTTTPFNLIEGKVYTLDIHVNLAWGGDGGDYCRIIWAFMTNNDSYNPTIFTGT